MKTTNLLVLLLTFLSLNYAVAQDFEGKLTFEMDYDLPESMEAQRSMMPSEMIMYVKGKNSRVEQSTMMGQQTVINNPKNDGAVLLMDMMGKKMAITMSNEEEEKAEDSAKPEITYTKETKVLDGYTCTKALVK